MHRIVGIFLIALFALRCVIPAGVMVRATTPDGPLELVLCSSSSHDVVIPALPAPEPSQQPSEDGSAKSDTCAFSTISSIAIVRDAHASLTTVVHDAAVKYRIAVDLFSDTPKLSGRSARGPPRLLG